MMDLTIEEILNENNFDKLNIWVGKHIFGYEVEDRWCMWDPECGGYDEVQTAYENTLSKREFEERQKEWETHDWHQKMPCFKVYDEEDEEEEEEKESEKYFYWKKLPEYLDDLRYCFEIVEYTNEKWGWYWSLEQPVGLGWIAKIWNEEMYVKYGESSTIYNAWLPKKYQIDNVELAIAICQTALIARMYWNNEI